MNERNSVVDGTKRFLAKGGVETDTQRKQDSEDGKDAIEALKACTKLPQEDREQIARQLGFHIHILRVDHSLLAKRSGFEPKELYRLVLKRGEETTQYRLRPSGKKYASLIETLAKLARPRTNVFALASRITRGTSVHPSGAVNNSEIRKLLNLIYSLAEGIDDKFRLSEKFASIAQMKQAVDRKDPWAYWPAQPTNNTPGWSRYQESPEEMESSFWLPSSTQQSEGVLYFGNWHWEQVIGYLPHFFLGHQKDFAWDHDYWPAPNKLIKKGKDEEWYEQLPHDMFKVLGGNPRITTAWDTNNERLLFNGEPFETYRRRMCQFQNRICVANAPDNWSKDEENSSHDAPAFFWLCIYPNADATGVVPVVLSTNWEVGADNTIELLDEQRLSNMIVYPVLGDETLGTRIRRALLVQQDNQEPILKTEWLRTTRFVDLHPLRLKYQDYQATERHIKKWREQVLKGNPLRDNQQENEE